MTSTLFLLTLIICILAVPTTGHFNLKAPMPYNRIDCNAPDCTGPCPMLWRTGYARARNTPESPSEVWERGATVRVSWHRNNHEGGYYRRSLVPVNQMFSHYHHEKYSFEYGCFAQGRYKCGKSSTCGTDMNGFAYRNEMRIPEVFPDGDYVFAMAWFGGLHWKRKRAEFHDYYTCAFVRIKGGPFAPSYKPTFIPGKTTRTDVTPGTCASTSDFVGECNGDPCHHKPVKNGIPGVFAKGSGPAELRLKDIAQAVSSNTPAKAHFADDSSPEERKTQKEEQAKIDATFWAADRRDHEKMLATPAPLESSPAPLIELSGPMLWTQDVTRGRGYSLTIMFQSCKTWVNWLVEELSKHGFVDRDMEALGL